jgi:hypothetical protein
MPTAVMPLSLSRAFTEVQTFPARVNEYHDGASQRSACLSKPRRSWQLAKRLPASLLAELREFWQAQGVGAFYFYNPKETNPPFSYDPTGAATPGRYRVRFASPWSQTVGLGLVDTAAELVELFSVVFVLKNDLAFLMDASGSLTWDDLGNMEAAANSIIDSVSPLQQGGIAAYCFDFGPHLLINVSHDIQAIKAALNSFTLGGSTALYDCIVAAVLNTTAKNIVIMTDGENTVGARTPQEVIAVCVANGNRRLYPIGFGSINPTIMQQLAVGTGGVFYPAANSQSLSAIVEFLLADVAT